MQITTTKYIDIPKPEFKAILESYIRSRGGLQANEEVTTWLDVNESIRLHIGIIPNTTTNAKPAGTIPLTT